MAAPLRPPPPPPPVAAAKAALLRACASPPVDRAALDAPLATLAAANVLIDGPYEGEWRTLYTDSVGPSAGRVGPLKGEVLQTFAGDASYVNQVSWPSTAFPILSAKLAGTASRRRRDRVDVVFESTDFYVAGVRVGGREFAAGAPGSRGHWELVFEDDDARVFKTNKGSLFVLTRAGAVE